MCGAGENHTRNTKSAGSLENAVSNIDAKAKESISLVAVRNFGLMVLMRTMNLQRSKLSVSLNLQRSKLSVSCNLLVRLLGYLALLIPFLAPAQNYQEKIVAAVLASEAISDGREGLLAVAEVIRQRSHEKGRSAYQIVTARRKGRSAFSCLNGTTPDRLYRRRYRQADFNLALQVAMVLCRTPEKIPSKTLNATHYTRKEEKPAWAKGRQPVAIIGAHAFYRLSRY